MTGVLPVLPGRRSARGGFALCCQPGAGQALPRACDTSNAQRNSYEEDIDRISSKMPFKTPLKRDLSGSDFALKTMPLPLLPFSHAVREKAHASVTGRFSGFQGTRAQPILLLLESSGNRRQRPSFRTS